MSQNPVYCLIPAAGKGTRMRPLTHTVPKAMLPVAGKPGIFHIIDTVVQAGVRDFVIITGYLRELMESEILSAYPDLNIRFVEQKEQKGLGHAIYLSEPALPPGAPMLIVYGDTLFKADLRSMLSSDVPRIGVYTVDDPSRFGVVLPDSEGRITRFIEKPSEPVSRLAIPGVNYFPDGSVVFRAVKDIIAAGVMTKNEFQVTDGFEKMISDYGLTIKVFPIDEWHDAGTLEAMLETNRAMIRHTALPPESGTIIPPVCLGANVVIRDSVIGPNVSVGDNVEIIGSEVSESIVDHHCRITSSVLRNSILGRKVIISDFKGTAIAGDNTGIHGPAEQARLQ